MRRKDCEKKGKFGNFNFLPFSLYINESDAGRKEKEVKWQSWMGDNILTCSSTRFRRSNLKEELFLHGETIAIVSFLIIIMNEFQFLSKVSFWIQLLFVCPSLLPQNFHIHCLDFAVFLGKGPFFTVNVLILFKMYSLDFCFALLSLFCSVP